MAEEKKRKENVFEVVKVPTDHTIMIQTPEGELMTNEQALAKCLQELSEIKKVLG